MRTGREKSLYSIVAVTLLVCALMSPALANGDGAEDIVSPRIVSLKKALDRGEKKALNAFWKEVERNGTPLIEDLPADEGFVLVTFLYKGENQEADNVRMHIPDYRSEDKGIKRLTQLKDSNVWFLSLKTEATARFPYSLVWPEGRSKSESAVDRWTVDGVVYEFFRDPLAQKTYVRHFGESTEEHSYAEGPISPAEHWLAPRESVAPGDVVTFKAKSQALGNTRDVSVYTPAMYDPGGKPYPFIVIFDHNAYLHSIEVPVLLDNMIAEGVIPPMIAMFISNVDRGDELPPNTDFAYFIAEELLPTLREQYNLTDDSKGGVIAGASYGGLASSWIAYKYPSVFGNVLSQSGSYWWHPGFDRSNLDAYHNKMGWLPRKFVKPPASPIRFYLEVGLWEGSHMVLTNRYFRDILQAKGYEVTYREFTGGHDFLSWRGTFPYGLIALIGTEKGRRLLLEYEDEQPRVSANDK